MKIAFIFSWLLLLPFAMMAQTTPFASVYDDFKSKSGYVSSEIKPGSTNFEWEQEYDYPQFREMISRVETIRMVRYQPDADNEGKDRLWKKIQKAASDNRYAEVMSVDAESVTIRMYMLKEQDGITREVALAVKENNGVMLATMDGVLDFSDMFSAENMKAWKEMADRIMDSKGSCGH